MANRPSLWEELRRRKVVRVGAAYVVGAVAVGGAADVFLPGLGAPEWVLRVVLGLLVLGLPLALTLAWAYDVTPGGIERTAPAAAGATGVDAPGPVAADTRGAAATYPSGEPTPGDPHRAPPEAEPRVPTTATVTLLLTSFVGIGEIRGSRGDGVALQALRSHNDLLSRHVQRHGGRKIGSMGDTTTAVFGSPRRALDCACAVQRGIESDIDATLGRLVARMGLTLGEVTEEDGHFFGKAVDAARYVHAAAAPGGILASEALHAVVGSGSGIGFVEAGSATVDEIGEEIRLFEVPWKAEGDGRDSRGRESLFVGRVEERETLAKHRAAAAAGRGRLVVIGGEPGVGKSSLTEEVVQGARAEGIYCATGHCFETDATPPYIPFVEILEHACRAVPPAALREHLGDGAPEVARLTPRLRQVFPDLAPPIELPPEQSRRLLFQSVSDYLERHASTGPMLLVLEDLHWADEPTMLLLEHVAQRLARLPILILGTYRDVELDVKRPLARTLTALGRRGALHRISLKRFGQDGVAGLLAALGGGDPPADLVSAVYSETDGNPFFVRMVFQHLEAEGRLFDETGAWRTGLSVAELEVPEGVRLVVGQWLERVGDETRRVLTAASVIGRGFAYEVLPRLVDLPEESLLDALDEAERAFLITGADEGHEARFTFSHELIRQTLLGQTSLPRRQRLHVRVAEALEQVYGKDVAPYAPDLAYHLFQAGAAADPEKAVRYITLAVDQAMEADGYEDALRLVDQALSIVDEGDARGRADLLRRRGLALRAVGRPHEALEAWDEALAGYELPADAEAVGEISYLAAWECLWSQADPARQGVYARRGLEALGDRVSLDRCRLLAQTASTMAWDPEGDYERAEEIFAESERLAERLDDPGALGHVLGIRGDAYFSAGYRVADIVSYSLRGAELLRAGGDPNEMATALASAQFGLAMLGRFDEARGLIGELAALGGRLGNDAARFGAVYHGWMLDVLATGFARSDEALAEFLDSGVPWEGPTRAAFGTRSFLRGRWEEAEASFRAGEALNDPILGWPVRAGLLRLLAHAGREDEVDGLLTRFRADDPVPFPRLGRPSAFGSWPLLSAAVEALAVLGRRDEAGALYPLFLEGAARSKAKVVHVTTTTLTERISGIAAACAGGWEAAEGHFDAARRQAHELPVPIEAAEVDRWHAHALLDRGGPGDAETAQALLIDAVEAYERLEMPRHAAMARELMATG